MIEKFLKSAHAVVLQETRGTAADLAEFGHVAPSHSVWGSLLPHGAALVHRRILALFREVRFGEIVQGRTAVLRMSADVGGGGRCPRYCDTWCPLAR